MPPMDLHGNLGKSKLGRYLLIHEAGSDQSEHFPLAGGQGLEKHLQIQDDLLGLTPAAVPFDRGYHGIQHVLVTKWFGQEIHRSTLHGLDGHRNIAMAGHENDWNVNVRLGQFSLKVEAAQSGKPDVEHQTAGNVRQLALQHVGGRTEYLNPKAYGLKQV